MLSDDKYYRESYNESYTTIEVVIRRVLKVAIPDSDDEVIQKFDHDRGQTQKDTYHDVLRADSDYEKRMSLNLRRFKDKLELEI